MAVTHCVGEGHSSLMGEEDDDDAGAQYNGLRPKLRLI